MALRIRSSDGLLARAFGVSLGLHVLLALFLPIWAPPQSGGTEAVEQISFAHLTHVAIQRPKARSLPAALPQTKHHAAKVSFARTRSELSARTHKPRALPTAQNGPRGVAAAAPKEVRVAQAPLYARAPASEEPISSTIEPTAPKTPSPESTVADRAATGSGANNRGGVLPLGAAQDPVLDPHVFTALQQKFAVHVTLVVTVGEDGRTKNVTFEPPIDPATEHAISAMLATASWDAAVCGGGVSCEGVARIKL